MGESKTAFKLDVRDSGLGEKIERFEAQFPERLARILTQTATTARKAGIDEIASKRNFKRSYLREKIELFPATRNRLTASLLARDRDTRLDRFDPKQVFANIDGQRRPAGISVLVNRQKGRKRIASGFYVPLRKGKVEGSNGKGIAVRNSVLRRLGIKTEAIGGAGSRAYSILHTISVYGSLRAVVPKIEPIAIQRVDQLVQREYDRAFKGDL